MSTILENKIRGLISYVLTNPGEDVSHIADRFLSGNIQTSSPQTLIVPELLKLSPSKRALVINIVRSKTNYNLSSDEDYSNNYVKIKEVGEVMREIPHLAKKIKWFFQ